MASPQIKIGNYTLLETLGVGSFGKVKLAVHSQTKHKVAVKIINRKRISNLDMSPRVKREIEYLFQLRHIHIIKMYEVMTTPTHIIMVMEYAGNELFNYIVDKGRMAEDDARRFFQQIICAIEYCHKHNIVHRDLKPENVLLDDQNNVKIADFGLSNFISDGDFLKTSCGSPNYAAPEVISGRLYAGPEVDVWSCGVILYVMLCGRLPFDDEYIPTLFKKINSGIYALPSFLSNGSRQLITAMLTVDPMKRIAIPEIRKNDWFNVNLPDYLQLIKVNEGEEAGIIFDESIITELQRKMGFDKDLIRSALKEDGNNQIKVAYQLVQDHNRFIQTGALSVHDKYSSFKSKASSPVALASARSPIERDDSVPNTIQVLSSSIPKESSSTLMNLTRDSSSRQGSPPPMQATSSQSSTRTTTVISSSRRQMYPRSRWHCGIRSRSFPLDIMRELYRAIQAIPFLKFKSVDEYKIRCLFAPSPSQVELRFEIQLWKMNETTYLVDFKNLTQSSHAVFPFFDACCQIITELAVSS